MAVQKKQARNNQTEYTNSYQEDVYQKSKNDQVKQSLPGYHIIRELGHGSQGKVFLGIRESDQTKVAIKRLNIGSVKNWKEYELFQREAQTLSSLDIPGVAKFYEAVERLEDNPPCSYIIQEYIVGNSLNEMLKTGHRFGIDIIYDIIIQMLEILKALHTHNPPIIHRDIKPSNVLLEPKGEDGYSVRLIDFGAVANPQVQGGGSTVAGTYGYMPPEQLMGKPEPASDIYSLAAMAVHLISGRSPADMPAKDFHLIFEPDMEHMPLEVVATLRSMLDPKVESRFCDIDELIKTFKNYKQNIYNIINSQNVNIQSITDKEYNAKLVEYKKIGSEGAVELWQRLPDAIPRKVPSPYSFLKKNFLKNERKNFNAKKTFLIASFLGSIVIISILPFILSLIASYSDISTALNSESGYQYEFDVVTFVILSIVIIVIIGIVSIKKNKSKYMQEDEKAELEKSSKDNENAKFFNYLLKNGKKTVATIQDITYIPAKDNLLIKKKWNVLNSSDNPLCYYHYRGVPTFRITYKFNPPDDEDERSILRNYIFHDEPDLSLHVGDPLPVLYVLYCDTRNKKTEVLSMPFPVPLYAHVNFREIMNGKDKDWADNCTLASLPFSKREGEDKS